MALFGVDGRAPMAVEEGFSLKLRVGERTRRGAAAAPAHGDVHVGGQGAGPQHHGQGEELTHSA